MASSEAASSPRPRRAKSTGTPAWEEEEEEEEKKRLVDLGPHDGPIRAHRDAAGWDEKQVPQSPGRGEALSSGERQTKDFDSGAFE